MHREFKTDQKIDAFHQVIVTLSIAIKDLDGHEMSDDFSWAYVTGASVDTSNPAINGIDFTITVNGTDTPYDEEDTGIITESADIKFTVDATDDSRVDGLFITETATLDEDGNAINEEIVHDPEPYVDKTFEYEFTFDTGSYGGRKELEFMALDPYNKYSEAVIVNINLDAVTAIADANIASEGIDKFISK